MMRILLSALILGISLKTGNIIIQCMINIKHNYISAHGIKCYIGTEDINVEGDCPNESYCSKFTVSGGGQDVSGLACGSATNGFSNNFIFNCLQREEILLTFLTFRLW